PAPILRGITRIGRQIGEAAIHLPVQIVLAVARQVAGIVDLELVAEMHADPLLAPAVVHLIVGPHGCAGIANADALLLDVAPDDALAYVPARGRPPVVIDPQVARFAIEERSIDVRRHQSEILRREVANDAERCERSPDALRLVSCKHTVLRGPDAAVQLERSRNVTRPLTVIGRPADPARVKK